MAAAGRLSITLVPVLMGYLIRGRIRSETENPVNRVLARLYAPCLDWTLHRPRTTLLLAAVILAMSVIPLTRLGSEFMPPLDEGDLLYMPTALPGLSIGNPAETFWIIKHGVKMSAMPAWGATHDDRRMWAMVVFLQQLPRLTPAQYQILTARADGEEGGHDHGTAGEKGSMGDMPGMAKETIEKDGGHDGDRHGSGGGHGHD